MKKIFTYMVFIFILFSSTLLFAENSERSNTENFFSTDEFSESGSEFLSTNKECGTSTECLGCEPKSPTNWNRFYWAISILGFGLLAGPCK